MKKISALIGVIISLFFYDVALAQYQSPCVSCNNSTANSSENASVIGPYNNANVINSVVIGNHSSTNGWHSIVLGNFSTTAPTGINSIAIGMHTSAVAGQSMVIGLGNSSAHVLSNTYQQSLMIGFNSDLPTFFVSRSSGYGKTGQVVIGNRLALPNGPQAKLHIRADEGEEAAVFVEPNSWVSKATARLYLGSINNNIMASYDYGLIFSSAHNYLFETGKVGIGTWSPQADLDVEGTFRIGAFAEEPGQHKLIFADQNGILFTDNIPLYDNMGDCVAENDIITNGHWIKFNSEDEAKGIYITPENKIGIGTSMPHANLDVHSENETHIIAFSSTDSRAGFWAANSLFAYGLEVDDEGTGHITANFNTPQNIMNFYSNGKVSIGNVRPKNGTSHRLFVEGGIQARR